MSLSLRSGVLDLRVDDSGRLRLLRDRDALRDREGERVFEREWDRRRFDRSPDLEETQKILISFVQ